MNPLVKLQTRSIDAKRRFPPHSLKTKLILSILLILGLFIVILVVNNIILDSIIIRNTNQSVLNSVNQADISLSHMLEQAKEQAYQLSGQVTERDDVEKLLTRDSAALSKYDEYDMTVQYIAELTKIGMINKLESIYVYSTAREKLITSNNGVFDYKSVTDYPWMARALSEDRGEAFEWLGACPYLNELQRNPHAYIISLICRAHRLNRTIRSEVYFGLNFTESALFEIFKEIDISPNTAVYLVDENGIVISTRNKASIGESLQSIVKDAGAVPTNGPAAAERISVDGRYFQRIVVNNTVTGWSIVVFVPEAELMAQRKGFWLFVVFTMSLVFFGSVFIAYRTIVEFVDRPVMKLMDFMKKVEKGDFKVSILEERRDEFGALYTGFNEMVERIDVLIRELYQEKLLKRDIELKYLQKLINPHFLYNTLDTIRWLAEADRLSDVSSLTLVLSRLYRATFSSGKDFVSIDESIASIENYLFIHKVRLGDVFTYAIDVEAEARGHLILNLILQPLVENALIHGIQKREGEGGLVKITAKMRGNLIHIRVYDNGMGIRPEKLRLIRANMKADNEVNDSGLKIVNRRIMLIYGEKYALRLRSACGRGTCISFSYPVFERLPRG